MAHRNGSADAGAWVGVSAPSRGPRSCRTVRADETGGPVGSP
jgi:hypothetical protein